MVMSKALTGLPSSPVAGPNDAEVLGLAVPPFRLLEVGRRPCRAQDLAALENWSVGECRTIPPWTQGPRRDGFSGPR
jgi:hypothetical protein